MGRITAICQFRWEVGSVYNCDGGSEFGEGGGMMLDWYTITKWYLHETLSIHFLGSLTRYHKKKTFQGSFLFILATDYYCEQWIERKLP